MKTLWGFLGIVGPLIVVPAMAADLGVRAPAMPMKAPPPAPAYNWSGCYIGGGGGYGMIDQEHDLFDQFGPIAATADTGGRGWFGTVSGGCDVQFGSFLPNLLAGSMLLGGFADADWGGIKGKSVLPLGILGFQDEFGDEKLDQSWAAGARLGWLPTDRFLTFVSGGYTNVHVNDVNFATLGGTVFETLPGHRQGGWFIGTGYEYNLGWFGFSGLTWKTEYRWNDYGSRTDQLLLVPSGAPSSQSNSHLFVQTVTSQLIWRFNWGGPGTY